MAQAFHKVRSGGKLRIPAAAYNAFVDAAQDLRQRQHARGQGSTPESRQTGIVLVRNDSGAERDRFDVLGIDGVVIAPADNLDAFKNRIVLAGVTPTEDHAERFVVLAEPLAAGAMGSAVASGVTVARVNVADTTHRFAGIDDVTHLTSSDTGAAAILWAESGTGTKWAVVRIGAGSADSAVWVRITGFTLISGASHRWQYAWVEQKLDRYGAWSDKPGGRTSAATGILAYNSIETNNSASGIQGNSVNLANLPEDWEIKPVQGSPVVLARFVKNCAADLTGGAVEDYLELIFQYENAVDGAGCA